MWSLRSQTSPSSTTAQASVICALPPRSAFTSEPRRTMPASIVSTNSNLCLARRLVTTSPEAGRRGFLSFFLIRRLQLGPPPRGIDPGDADRDRLPQPQALLRALADQR